MLNRAHQENMIDKPFPKGVAFPFIKRFLAINKAFPDQAPVEVVLLSRNSPETGLRVFRSIKHYGLDITRAGFMTGSSPYEYIPAFNSSLFLSSNETDVRMKHAKILDNARTPGNAAGDMNALLPVTVLRKKSSRPMRLTIMAKLLSFMPQYCISSRLQMRMNWPTKKVAGLEKSIIAIVRKPVFKNYPMTGKSNY